MVVIRVAKEAMDRIYEAEEQAAACIREAQEQARILLAKAKEEAPARIWEALSQVAAEEKKFLDQASKEGGEQAEIVEAQYEQKVEAVAKAAKQCHAQAIEAAISCILE